MSEWREIRQKVLQRDNRQCQVCGKEHSGQVHHILPRSQGGTNDLANLITLCGKCHMVISPVPEWLLTKLWQIPQKKLAPQAKPFKTELMKL
ncbi:HNH endonuclease [Chroococcidiopsis sp. CCNUC1]|uniref:HNH endonuclease n=1 Tax=Chroococcidiopsis sp. CCNUC1 TaxID=2653189 RepID=UPI0020224A15|nr:HNH endonuclease [Chroococcidiopsis sp. CCNUC1]URD51674.1 HNH endonuclease [Chroococcidiopsis sp. CCNUC1]